MNTNKVYEFEAVTREGVIILYISLFLIFFCFLIPIDLIISTKIKTHPLRVSILIFVCTFLLTYISAKFLCFFIFNKRYKFIINNETIYIYKKKMWKKITIADLEQVKLMKTKSFSGYSIAFFTSGGNFFLSSGLFYNNKSNCLKMELFFNEELKPFLLEKKFNLNDKIGKNHIEFILSKNH